MTGKKITMGRAKIPIKLIMFVIASSGVDIDRTINLASGNS